ncbi:MULTISPECIES: hypothetical protein [Halobacillus]|uniref:Uncharacterized protein n=1 Tax=Halobacillus andaensis TaxID=1176239 RepID=A0A917B3A1_HALAA|nr:MULTISPECIES: hypothetical protein [Halobacillus]MBP2004075.1 hypothetical protein [Halobacillus andaensis]MCP3026701.1 hypothetical protein [Halobacillus sp. A5]GGF15594.1 hypothetical protein GCM10010954_12790 [Halobacillus andaensis]
MDKQNKDDKRWTEVRPFDERQMEPKRLSDAKRKEMEADQHTVGGF